MHTSEMAPNLAALLDELIDGRVSPDGPVVLNTGDLGLLGSLARLSGEDASRSIDAGATIAAHARHLTIGLHLMNRWALDGSDPFANPMWDEAWKTTRVGDAEWRQLLSELKREAHAWREVLRRPREISEREFGAIVGSLAHVAYHLGAMRQIARAARGPRGGTFKQ